MRPCGNVPISDDFSEHVARNSAEPGVDYVVPSGTDVRAVSDGTIDLVKNTTSGATGRIVGMWHDDGNYSRHLHLSGVSVSEGQTVQRGHVIASSGGSGYGQELYYGAHVHTSLWLGAPFVAQIVDFEQYVGGEEDMPDYIHKTHAPNQSISTSGWTTYRINSQGWTSVVTGVLISAVANFTVSGVPSGATLYARFVRVDSDGSNLVNLGTAEVIGTGGNTMNELTTIIDLASNRKLRLQMKANQSGVVLEKWSAKAFKWV